MQARTPPAIALSRSAVETSGLRGSSLAVGRLSPVAYLTKQLGSRVAPRLLVIHAGWRCPGMRVESIAARPSFTIPSPKAHSST